MVEQAETHLRVVVPTEEEEWTQKDKMSVYEQSSYFAYMKRQH
jgi:hypothetical protein